MAAFSPSTTWLGFLGGGVSGAIFAGGSIYQIDLWNMGGKELPIRVMVKGTRVGAVAHTGTALAALLVKECATAKDMDGLTDGGLDWEFAAGVSGSAVVKSGGKLFKELVAIAEEASFATTETAKRFVNWMMDDLAIVKPGKAFHLIPYPIQFGIGGGIFYEWQTLSVLGGKVAWQLIKPSWSVTNSDGGVCLQMWNIPEQDGERIRIAFTIDEWGIDPYISWKKEKGDARVGEKKYHIEGVVYGGYLFESKSSFFAGLNLSNFVPIGRMEEGVFSGFSDTKTVAKSGKLTVKLNAMHFANMPYWTASDALVVAVDSKGRFSKAEGSDGERH